MEIIFDPLKALGMAFLTLKSRFFRLALHKRCWELNTGVKMAN